LKSVNGLFIHDLTARTFASAVVGVAIS